MESTLVFLPNLLPEEIDDFGKREIKNAIKNNASVEELGRLYTELTAIGVSDNAITEGNNEADLILKPIVSKIANAPKK
jgi:hypothetical protein